MKYIPLSSLQNPYSSILNYRNEQNGVSIKGFYEENSLFIPTLDTSVGIIPGTSFRFIVRISEGTFTSSGFYNDILLAKSSKNPYFINAALNPNLFVNIDTNQLRQTFFNRNSVEKKYKVTCIFNNLFDAGGGLDLQRFGQYIDWVVSKPSLNEIVSNGVLNSSQISEFIIPEWTFEDIDLPDSATGGGGGDRTPVPETWCNDPKALNYRDFGQCIYPPNPNGGGSVGTPTPGGGNASIGGSGAGIGESTTTTITIEGQEFEINLVPPGIVGGSTPSGEGEQGNPTPGQGSNRGGVLGGGNYSNPNDAIANEYEYRPENTNYER